MSILTASTSRGSIITWLRQILLCLIAMPIAAFNWSDVDCNSDSRNQVISALFKDASAESGIYRACVVVMGSYSYGIPFPDSDIEFALLIPQDESKSAFAPLLESFFRHCEQHGIQWDKNGWHPPIACLNSSSDSETLIASPVDLARLRAKGIKSTLCYALYNPQFCEGNYELYNEFRTASRMCGFDRNWVVAAEREKTKRNLELTRREAKAIKSVCQNGFLQANSSSLLIEIKNRWIKPAIELLQYLCMLHDLTPANVADMIDQLSKIGCFPQEFAAQISDFLLFSFELRERLGKKIPGKQLLPHELQKLVDSYDLLYKLSLIQK